MNAWNLIRPSGVSIGLKKMYIYIYIYLRIYIFFLRTYMSLEIDRGRSEGLKAVLEVQQMNS